MATAYIDRLLWFPIDLVDVNRIVSDLTLHTEEFIGPSETIALYELADGHIGVPRAWGLEKKWLTDGFEIETRWSEPYVEWPELKFPEGWTWWKGQKESVDGMSDMFSKKIGGLLEAGCGAGKTLMGLAVAARLRVPTLVVIHKTDLAEQWRETGATFFSGCRMGHVQQDKWNYRNCHFVTASAGTLFSQRDSLPSDFMPSFGMVIFDEGHRYPARTFEKVMRLPTAKYRMAVSATWKRNDGLECVWHWHIGHLEHRTASTRLVGKYIQIKWNTHLTDALFSLHGSVHMAKWVNGIVSNAPYNVWLSEEIPKAAGVGRKVLAVSDRVEHLVELRNRMLKQGCAYSIGMYVGGLPGPTGKRKPLTKEELKSAKECDIILATYGMMAEGTDIPALDTLFLTTPRSDIEQVIGRIQRPKDDKKSLLIIDPVFQTGYNKRMAEKRVQVYGKLKFTEQGKD